MEGLRLAARGRPRARCVLVHGRGQTPADLAPLAAGWEGIEVALPAAPGRSWYDARAVDPLTPATERQLAASLAAIDAAVAEAGGAGGAPGPEGPMLLAGFSQGACLLVEWALSRGRWDGALVALTGCRVGGGASSAARLDGLPAYLTGSDADPWIPAAAFGEAAGALAAAGARLVAEAFPGRPHEVSRAERARLDHVAADLVAGRPALAAA